MAPRRRVFRFTPALLAFAIFFVALFASSSAHAEPACDETSMARVYARAKPSIVRIERPDGGLGTGFMFYTPRHILTAFHVVDLGRSLFVKFANGKRMAARVVAVDSEHDLAMLELESAVPDAPVLPAHVDLEVGMHVFAIGNPYGDASENGTNLEGLLNYSTTHGTVSAFNSEMFQTDALLAPGNSGGPLLACDGGVVGVADLLLDNRIGFAVRIQHGLALAARVAVRKSAFAGTISLRDATLAVLAETDAYDYLGVGVGGRIVAYDRFAIDARLGALFQLSKDTSDPVVSRTVARGTAELTLGYRALFFAYAFPTYVTLSAGGAGMIDRGSQHSLSIQYSDPNCPGLATCVPKLVSQTTAIRGGSVAPMASLHLTFGSFDVGYAFKLDVIHPEYSTQRVLVGLVF